MDTAHGVFSCLYSSAALRASTTKPSGRHGLCKGCVRSEEPLSSDSSRIVQDAPP